MNEIITSNIQNKIYKINGVEVMLDSDLAELYQVETKRINEAVKRNPEKFPARYSWVLSEEDISVLWSQNSTANISNKSRVLPRVFVEQGIYMLGTILKSDVATKVSIAIMDTFVNMRHYINYNIDSLPHKYMLLEEKVDENTKRINAIFDKFSPDEIVKNRLFFKGEIYDAYSLLIDIFNSAKEEIIIVDNYIGKEILDILKTINKKIIIVTKNTKESLITKYKKQYSNITFIKNDSFHDRFIILDRNVLYNCGASFKDLGKKCFYIGEIDNIEYLMMVLETINI